MVESEINYDLLPRYSRDRATRLVATLVKEALNEQSSEVFIDGVEVAIRFFPETFKSFAERTQANSFIHELLEEWDVDSYSDIVPFNLSREERDMFVFCGGGVNEETGIKLKNFFHDPNYSSKAE
ncbi:hypothetical protein A3A76_06030 [Candidatus Woesebacteria bacterium RIFCSPLOWO2_01_FULL_39_23]|uniref:Uncharacterized protein n=1 Tax=Candidatus Woesebacteria bacterium RIFCSPHIGHO2_01_FULL_40_22 TaxID=1802499 RepID=A0A1F7YIE6_9BACT|nr:MAG: hypothetical protein A2141_02725 [Candidatus Woesebacteria bacterium RBG_16_40_11]OGM26960.1 MAG: hypothetical protein A2628_05970 [Candidatus Woesebacteria bacterium RIFCSPHIGHO2_01_FULL_40_22]OGM37367.1 MAG: hypothetical protein A3E41_04375 [Candidatus Woesebacteria bacterium RIFCSPHIGHO2_12_FULL_38_9]OGM63235.1 MAG: hypothetical protein A3A76_06030 [Candidatus Woesebacteria bacterium RIFCSPLOWO2_01_FULL_39_23]